MKVVWTDRAKARLKKIHAYIAHDSAQTADEVIVRLVRRSQNSKQ